LAFSTSQVLNSNFESDKLRVFLVFNELIRRKGREREGWGEGKGRAMEKAVMDLGRGCIYTESITG
jgi:hypothetical protein